MIPGQEIWHKILWNTYKILEYVRSLTRIWQKIVVAEILDQVSQSDSWKIIHINKIFQESDSASGSKIQETTILCHILVRFCPYSQILYVFHKILCQIFRPRLVSDSRYANKFFFNSYQEKKIISHSIRTLIWIWSLQLFSPNR